MAYTRRQKETRNRYNRSMQCRRARWRWEDLSPNLMGKGSLRAYCPEWVEARSAQLATKPHGGYQLCLFKATRVLVFV